MVVLCGARIGDHCGWPPCSGKSTCSEGKWLHVHSPCWGLNFSFVRTGNVAAGGSPAGGLITPYVRGLLGVGGWEGWLSVDPLVLLCVCSERASASVGDGLARSLLFLGYNLQ